MGIKGLAKLLSDEAPECIKEVPLSSLHGRKIAIDASMAIYQFLIAVRSGNPNSAAMVLTNSAGETTSHVQGIFNRTIRFLTEGIRPVYVFDGKPPNIKSHELVKRREKREKAQLALKEAIEDDNAEEQTKQEKRLVRAGTKENSDCKKLLGLMGVPVVEAPCEAEAQAAELAKKGKVWGVGTEDMDALTFETPILLRKMTFANASKSDVQQLDYQKALVGLGLTREEFVDLCILLGCDYCDSIRGVGPKTALKLIREHSTIEKILDNIDQKKYGVPDTWIPNEVREQKLKKEREEKEAEEYSTDKEEEEEAEGNKSGETKSDAEEEELETLVPIYTQARKLFNEHEVDTDCNLKWTECQAVELSKYLVEDMGFNVDRVKNNIEKLQKAYKATCRPQTRMDSFFKPKPGIVGVKKRKVAPTTKKDTGKKGKKSAFGRRR